MLGCIADASLPVLKSSRSCFGRLVKFERVHDQSSTSPPPSTRHAACSKVRLRAYEVWFFDMSAWSAAAVDPERAAPTGEDDHEPPLLR
jgi:hypothetical protein